MTDLIINIAFVAAVVGLLILFGVGSLSLVARLESGTFGKQPLRLAVLEALRPWAAFAIRSAETLALKQFQSTQKLLSGTDKKAVADRFYALLPDTLWVAGRAWHIGAIKALISQPDWESLVQRVFDEGETLLTRNETWLQKQIELLTTHTIPTAPIAAPPMPALPTIPAVPAIPADLAPSFVNTPAAG